MPRSDVTVFYSTDAPTFAFVAGAKISAQSSAVSASEGSNSIQVNVIGASVFSRAGSIGTDETLYPTIAATRGGSPNLYQDSADAERDRWSIGQMDSCHIIGFDSGGHQDPPLLPGYINRVDGNIEILAAHPTGKHYLSTYHNITEAFADDLATTPRAQFIRDYIDSLDGPGTDDGWAYDSAGEKVLLFANQSTINNSNFVAENNGLTYPEWYADNVVQPFYIDPHAAAGVKIGGAGGINIMLDNFQLHSNKSGIDWNNSGDNNNAQDWYDLDVPRHVYSFAQIASITRSGTVATVTMANDHPLLTGDDVLISNCAPSGYNGITEITVTGSDTFTYTVSEGLSPTTELGEVTAVDKYGQPRIIAAQAYSSLRANMQKGRKRFISNNPGMWVLTNTNQWADDKITRAVWGGAVDGLRDCITEYRLNGNPDKGDINGGFSEGITSEATTPEVQQFPRSGVQYNGLNAGGNGTWQKAYNNIYQSVRLVQPPGIVHASWGVECLQPGSAGPGVPSHVIYSHIPASNAKWHLARWAMCTSWIAGAYVAITGIVVGSEKAGRAASTPHFDEMGIINQGTTGLSHKWMGAALEPPPTNEQLTTTKGEVWWREFENALVIVNTDNDETNSPAFDAIIPVASLPGGAGAWKRINGFQDPSVNDGSVVDTNFSIPPIDGIVLQRVAEPVLYPLLGTVRVSTFNYAQDGAISNTDRNAMGLMDAVLLGGFWDGVQDSDPPATNYISRVAVSQSIIDHHVNAFGVNDIYLCTYVNQMEAGGDGEHGTYIYSQNGPNGTDWWYRDAAGVRAPATGGEAPAGEDSAFINLTNETFPDNQGRRYTEYYADEHSIAKLMDVHAAAGIGTGLGGMSPWYDNLGIHMRLSAIDADQDGQNADQQDFYDPDNPDHMTGVDDFGTPGSVAVAFMGEHRANQRIGIERVEAAYPGILRGGNHNQWAGTFTGNVTDPAFPYVMREYRIDYDDIDSKSFTTVGLSENNNWRPTELKDGYMRSHTLWTGVSSAAGGSWQYSYNNIYLPATKMQDPAVQFAEWMVDCLQDNTPGSAGRESYSPVPRNDSAWNAHRWGMATSMLCGAHYSCSGVIDAPTNTIGERRATPLFDEMGLINGAQDYGFGLGNTRLYRKWMGEAVDDVQIAARQGSWIWMREFENALVIINTNWDDSDPDETVDVSALPGGATEWRRFYGDQDPNWNDGTDASSDFTIPSIDAIFLVRKSWYDHQLKWHPGHYVKTQGNHAGDQTVYFDGVMSNFVSHVESSDQLLGAYVIYGWGALETDNGTYDWTRIYEHIAWLSARGKRLLIAVEHKTYSGETDDEWIIPFNLEGQTEPHQAGIIAGLWRTAVMDQYITFARALCAEFDDNPWVEQISFIPETCTGFGTVPGEPGDYTKVGYSTQIQRLCSSLSGYLKATVFTLGVNCPTDDEDANMIEAAYQEGYGRSGPDAHAVDGYVTFGGGNTAIRDYRGLVPHRVIVSGPNLGGFSDILPLSNIQTLLDDGKVTHCAWVLSDSTPGGTKADIIAHIETPGNGTYTTPPPRTITVYEGL